MTLQLGPVMGKIGGSEEPAEFVPDSPTSEMTVNLPDGEWGVCIGLEDPKSGALKCLVGVDGENIAEFNSVLAGNRFQTDPWALARHRQGTITITASGGNMKIISVVAFPDPSE